ncbi:oxidoreductase [Acuticoccus sediminis]|uniref:Oxidoreductase n=1 Tax=Acuticoccus sediminis TaxID=2184697 RepID=A0A8B2NK66_9HYPH|nr:NADH-quinone oxidoreductase subunit M [Acuticoccus sediminis]RAH96228.1 oxidoreductase [Acuticoccus sediminis]
MLTLAIFLPLAGALVLLTAPGLTERTLRQLAVALAAVPFLLLLVAWTRFDTGGAAFQLVEEAPWVPALGVAWRVGVDGISLALALMTALVFLAAVAWPMERAERVRQYYAWFLFLEAMSLGLFLTLDLLFFYVFFDLSLVGMFFLIGRWGHGERQAAALKFFIYTFVGSLAILLAIIALVLSTDPLTFDMRTLIAEQPLAGAGPMATLVFLGFVAGFAIKTPLFPVHTWLPPAHVDAPGPASAILAAVLLKMGTYGMVRMPLQMLPEAFAAYALPLAVLALVSILWGALVAFGQTSIKRRIAYTSVNHMGYTVLGIAAAGALLSGEEAARQLALTGAVVEMVAHGLITGALFLIAGGIWARAGTYEMDRFGGLAAVAPKLTVATVVAAFASLGLPGLAGFVAEVQIFVGTFAVFPWLAAIGLLGILVTAALFLTMLRQVFFGPLAQERRAFPDVGRVELAVLAGMMALVILIGVYPTWLLDMVNAATGAIVASAAPANGG